MKSIKSFISKVLCIQRLRVFLVVVLIITLVIALYSCDNIDNGGTNGENTTPPSSPPPTDDVSHIVDPDRSQFYGETLTIGTMSDFMLKPFASLYMKDNPGVTIEIIDYWQLLPDGLSSDEDILDLMSKINVELMAGSGPTLISSFFVDYRNPREAVYLADWFPVIKADPAFNEDDWFMNVFHASSVHGRLYSFPTMFTYYNVAVNSKVPGLWETLVGRSGITASELLDLHSQYAAGTELLLSSSFAMYWIMEYFIDSFMDFESGWVDFNNERFINLITHFKEIITKEHIDSWNYYDHERETFLSERFLFHIVSPSVPQYFIDFENGPIFHGHIPLTNENGDLYIGNWESYVLNANASPIEQALAWDFIKFITETENSSIFNMYLQPTNRDLFRSNADQLIVGIVSHLESEGWETRLSNEAAIQDAIKLMEYYGDKPMIMMSDVPRMIRFSIGTTLDLFYNDLITAERAAADIQNTVELMLMEMDILR
ncbi:MAG: extracellular solute-binding protein [Oscillospiraceae bacterium]|jgi:ABC-type glycerol-3-phosphate transport system substrate-binding protein|nr:extracellular solute-binding protein [Oscillospiraceae bacterium]